MKFAFFGYPHLGGTFTVFRHLRAGLAPLGITVEWLGVGPGAHAAARDPDWQSEWSTGHACGAARDSEPTQAKAMLSHLVDMNFDGVFVSVHADRVQTNLARYLPPSMLRVMIVHNITPATYAAARAVRDHVHATACVSRRICDDLLTHYRFDPRTTYEIHNAVDFPAPPPRALRTIDQPLRLLSLGRIEDQAKGVLWLPQILAQLPEDVTLTIAGDGPDLARLRRAMASLAARTRLLGRVSPAEIPALMAEHDIFVAPSRFEGFMITLVEGDGHGMRAGRVEDTRRHRHRHRRRRNRPAVSRRRCRGGGGDHAGISGAILPIGMPWPAKARLRCASASTSSRMADRYGALLAALRERRPQIAPPLPIERWHLPWGLRDGLRSPPADAAQEPAENHPGARGMSLEPAVLRNGAEDESSRPVRRRRASGMPTSRCSS